MSKRHADLIRAAREAKGLNRDQLAAKIGVHGSTITRIERQSQWPKSVRTLLDLGAALDLDLNDLQD